MKDKYKPTDEEVNQRYIKKRQELEEHLAKSLKESVNTGYIPRYVYRFQTNKYIEDILMHNRLYFSSPSQLNDPFDYRVNVEIRNSPKEIMDFLSKNNLNRLTDVQIKDFAGKIVSSPEHYKKKFTSHMNQTLEECRVCCFSSNWDNILLWSHYTDGHKGFALKFDLLADPHCFSSPLKINYSEIYPVVHFPSIETSSFELFLNTKYKSWEYEQEIRILKQFYIEEGNHYYNFKKEALVGIYFGARTSNEQIKKIIALSTTPGYNIEFKKTKLMEKQFGLLLDTV